MGSRPCGKSAKLTWVPSSPPQKAHMAIAMDCGAVWERWSCLKQEGKPAEELLGRDPTISIADHDKELLQLLQESQRSWHFVAWQQSCFQEEQRLKEAQALFAQERAHFKAERYRFTEAAIRRGLEIEMERSLFLKEQLLGFSLYSFSQAKTISPGPDSPGLRNRDPASWCRVSCSISGFSKSPGKENGSECVMDPASGPGDSAIAEAGPGPSAEQGVEGSTGNI
ncbi:afadin- and alpha-actinin-binding protein-like isoform 3-T3 [Trichechus inunguis]